MNSSDSKSFFEDCDENDDLQPFQLSGDENAERSVLLSDVAGKKASNHVYKLDLLLTVTTIMKTVIGAGILSLPLTVSKLGYVLALFMFIVIISIIQFTCILLLKAKNLAKHSNYSTIAYHIFRNRFMQSICSLAILINNLGICIVELTIFKATLKQIIDSYITVDWVKDQFYTSPIFIVLILALL